MMKKDTKSHIPKAGKKGKKSSSSAQKKASSKASPHRRKKSEKRQRTKCLPVRLTPAEHAYLKEVSASSGLKMGAYIRKTVLGVPGDRAQSAPSPNKEALAMLLAHIGKVGGNINQLAKRANTDGFGAITEDQFIDMKAQISAMRAMLMVALKPNGN